MPKRISKTQPAIAGDTSAEPIRNMPIAMMPEDARKMAHILAEIVLEPRWRLYPRINRAAMLLVLWSSLKYVDEFEHPVFCITEKELANAAYAKPTLAHSFLLWLYGKGYVVRDFWPGTWEPVRTFSWLVNDRKAV